MTARNYLSQIRKIDYRLRKIENDMEEARNRAVGMHGIDYSADRVQGAVNSGMPAVENYVDKTRCMQREYNRLAGRKRIIIRQIQRLDNEKYSELLYMRYVQYMSWDRIADRAGISKRQLYRIHNDALAYFQQTYLTEY